MKIRKVASDDVRYEIHVRMKNVRFTQVVQKSGQPEVYLLFTKPDDDDAFQKALQAHRIMTVHQAAGSKTDFGQVGYQRDVHAQLLIFPRSLASFENTNVVGIKYDLLHEESEKRPVPARREKEPGSRGKKAEARKKLPAQKPAATTPKEKVEEGKVLNFPAPAQEDSDEDSEIKAKVRRAVKALEAGKQVAAFHILKSILET